jgi:hypothetical protein
MEKMVGAGAEIIDKLEPEPHTNGPAPQHWYRYTLTQGAQENRKMLRAHIVKFFGTPYRTCNENFVLKFLDFIKYQKSR